MRIQVGISALAAALAVCAQANAIGRAGSQMMKRGLVVGEQQPAVVAAEAPADDIAADAVPVAPAAQPQEYEVQPVQQAASLQATAGVQRFADTTQIFIQPQAGVSVSPAAALSTIAAVPAAPAAPVQVNAPALTPVAAAAPAAVAAPAELAAPAAASAQLTAPAAAASGTTGSAAPLAARNYAELGYDQLAVPALAEAASAPVYAAQQYYAPAQPALQQYLQPIAGVQGGAVANMAPSAVLLNGSQLAPQAVIPLDPSLVHVLAQSTASASSASTSATEATSASADDSDEDNDDAAPSASEGSNADDADAETATVAQHHNRAAKGKVKAKPKARKAGADDPALNDSDVAFNSESAHDKDQESQEEPEAEPMHKVKAAPKSSSRSTKKKKASTSENDAEDDGVGLGDLASGADSAELETQSGYKRIGAAHQRNAHGSLWDEAVRAREEAAADAREAVLSEIRAQASEQAAAQASFELHLDTHTIVRDEEASANRMRDSYEIAKGYSRDEPQGSYGDEYVHTRGAEDEGPNTTTYGRYADTEAEYTNTWDVQHAVSWGNTHAKKGEAEETYRPYNSYSDAKDSYDRGSYSAGDSGYKGNTYCSYKEGGTYGGYKGSYGDYDSMVYPESAATTSYGDNSYESYSNCPYAEHTYEPERTYETQCRAFNFVNLHADSAFARDPAGTLAEASTTPAEPHAVDELDPLSYGTQDCSFRGDLPQSVNTMPSESGSIMVIGVPAPASPAPAAETVTRMITPAVKVVYASATNSS